MSSQIQDDILTMKKLIVDQLSHRNMHYRMRLDFMRNCSDDNFVNMIIARSNKTKDELYKMATSYIRKVGALVYTRLSLLEEEQRAELSVDPDKRREFIADIEKEIDEPEDIFIMRLNMEN